MSSFVKIIDDAIKTAVFEKFKSYFELDDEIKDIVFAPKEIAQRMIAEKRGEGVVEFISLWREGLEFDWGRQNTSIARKGIMLEYEDENTKESIITVKAVPIKMDYGIWFWSRNLDRMNLAVENYMKWIHQHPNLLLDYNNLYPLELYIRPTGVRDESDYSIYDKGKYFVNNLSLSIDGWILTSISSKTILNIILSIYLREGSPAEDILLQEYTISVNDYKENLIVPKYPENSNV